MENRKLPGYHVKHCANNIVESKKEMQVFRSKMK